MAPILHYLHDFLVTAPSLSQHALITWQPSLKCVHNLVSHWLSQKMEGLTQSLTFLGITLDTHCMEARLPLDKFQGICNQVAAWLREKNATKRDILSLVGHLQHATKVVKLGRTFVT